MMEAVTPGKLFLSLTLLAFGSVLLTVVIKPPIFQLVWSKGG